jgi:hypothetical protein
MLGLSSAVYESLDQYESSIALDERKLLIPSLQQWDQLDHTEE